jgi:tryptophan synthase alpha chain
MSASRIDAAFARARAEGRAALIVYVCAGDPSLDVTEALVPKLASAGADIIELGVPFSDPMADGPVIQAASERALRSGTSLRKVLAMIARLRASGADMPLALMSYLNPIHALGDLDAIARAGVDALILPDLPYDESPPWREAIQEREMQLIPLAAPTTAPERLAAIGEVARGFLYFVSVTGVTGARAELPSELASQLRAARLVSRAPVAVGFGIDSPAQARVLAVHADGVIVGSALVERLAACPEAALTFVRSLAEALSGTRPIASSEAPPVHKEAPSC